MELGSTTSRAKLKYEEHVELTKMVINQLLDVRPNEAKLDLYLKQLKQGADPERIMKKVLLEGHLFEQKIYEILKTIKCLK